MQRSVVRAHPPLSPPRNPPCFAGHDDSASGECRCGRRRLSRHRRRGVTPPARPHTDVYPRLMLGLIGRYDGLLWGLVAILCAIIASRILKWTVVRLEGRHPDEERELTRLRRGETAVALIATAI